MVNLKFLDYKKPNRTFSTENKKGYTLTKRFKDIKTCNQRYKIRRKMKLWIMFCKLIRKY